MNDRISVKFVTGEPDLHLFPPGTVTALKQEVWRCRPHLSGQHLRFICAGREVYDKDTVPAGSVLHCIPTLFAPQRTTAPAAVKREEPATSSRPAADWIDTLDLGNVLLWVLGSLLVLFWLVYLINRHMFDRVSLVMLSTMTFSFLIPYIVSLIPWPASWMMTEPQPCYYPSDWQGFGASFGDDRHGGTLQQESIPPRPAARVVGPSS